MVTDVQRNVRLIEQFIVLTPMTPPCFPARPSSIVCYASFARWAFRLGLEVNLMSASAPLKSHSYEKSA